MTTTPIHTFDDLLHRAEALPRKRILAIAPANAETFQAVAEATARLPVSFILVGDGPLCEKGLNEAGAQGGEVRIEHHTELRLVLERSMELARNGEVDVLMKGGVDTGTMMRAVLQESSGLRTGALLSDVFIMEFPGRTGNRLIMITDGGITLAPDLTNKADLIRNAVRVAHAFGNPLPKVAVLSATEFVLPNLPSTIDAAALSKMNERGQIKGCVVDGPYALDNAISPEAAAEKGIRSPVAGHAEILIAANIESANSLAKSTTYFAGLRLAHVIVGARIPILIPSRADRSDAKLLSIATGMIMSAHPTEGRGH
jgi:phosphate butyryltransferase